MTQGIHHVTAIARDPQRNVDFYVRVLGLRLVKQTVNFDDPATYHLYYGDEGGSPGTILTFFPWTRMRPGRAGTGQAVVTSLAVPRGSLSHWVDRLTTHGVSLDAPTRRFDDDVLGLRDPDGLPLELVETDDAGHLPFWTGGPVPRDAAIRGMHSVTLWEDDDAQTGAFLCEYLGFRELASAGAVSRFVTGPGGLGSLVDVRRAPGVPRGTIGVGSVHHVAWRAADDAAQLAARDRLAAAGFRPTPQVDRQYFRSIYFHEPGGVLCEIATDQPGFATDEPASSLGESLRLPPWLEQHRAELVEALPPIVLPGATAR